MRWLATLAVTAGFVTVAPAPTTSTSNLTAEQTQLAAEFLAPAPQQPPVETYLYTARAGLNARTPVLKTPTITAVRVVPKPVVKKKTTVKPAVKKPASTVSAAAPASSSRVNTVVGFALAQVGKPYKWGAAGPGAYDCSGLTMAAYGKVGIRLPHQSGGQASAGRAVSRSQLQRGDLIVYSGHVAIALGGGKMVHAANPRTGIVVATIYGSPTGYRRLL